MRHVCEFSRERRVVDRRLLRRVQTLEEERRLGALDRTHRILVALSDEEVVGALLLGREIIARLNAEFDFERCVEAALGGKAAWDRANDAERKEVALEVLLGAFPLERRRRIVNEFCKTRDEKKEHKQLI